MTASGSRHWRPEILRSPMLTLLARPSTPPVPGRVGLVLTREASGGAEPGMEELVATIPGGIYGSAPAATTAGFFARSSKEVLLVSAEDGGGLLGGPDDPRAGEVDGRSSSLT